MSGTKPPQARVTDPSDPAFDPEDDLGIELLGRRRTACARAGLPHSPRGFAPTGGRRNIGKTTTAPARPAAMSVDTDELPDIE
ncbi:MAG: hypothetical protein KC925_01270 [Candidatus Doudnabacteria bacterium]|nr:hypothetical protein [Candidatus Doudnabacteria bacterium]